jgi:hypothetical protein
MSLKRFVQQPRVRAELEYFRPPGPHRIPGPMKVSPHGGNPQRIGTAFDYLMRFELGRRVRRAEEWPWIAEQARNGPGFDEAELERLGSISAVVAHQKRRERCIRRVLRDARETVQAYRRKRKPSHGDYAELAGHALRLAALDEVYRTSILPSDFDTVSENDIRELTQMLSLAPIDDFAGSGRILLNPTFGLASRRVGGADADLICSDMLVACTDQTMAPARFARFRGPPKNCFRSSAAGARDFPMM